MARGAPEYGSFTKERIHRRHASVHFDVVRASQKFTWEYTHNVELDPWHSSGDFKEMIDPVKFDSSSTRKMSEHGKLCRHRRQCLGNIHPGCGHILALQAHGPHFFGKPG